MSYEEILTEARKIEEKHGYVLEENRRLNGECNSALKNLLQVNHELNRFANKLSKAESKVGELEKTNAELLAEALRLGKLHDDSEQKIAEQRKCLEDSDGIIKRLNSVIETNQTAIENKHVRISNQGKVIDALRKEVGQLHKEITRLRNGSERPENIGETLAPGVGTVKYKEPKPFLPNCPAAVFNWTPGQRFEDIHGVEYIKVQSTTSNAHAVNTKSGRLVHLANIIVKKDKYYDK